MGTHFLSEELNELIKTPFIFISYCWSSKVIFERVKALVDYLRKNEINVIYDEGGLEPGIELSPFETLIIHENCSYVLVVCDSEYVKRVDNGYGDVSKEYFYIVKDYVNNPMKYIPLKVDSLPSIFLRKAYVDFKDNSTFCKIKNFLMAKMLNNSNERNSDNDIRNYTEGTINNMQKRLIEINELYNNAEYEAAYRKIVKLITDSKRDKNIPNQKWLEIYNIKLIICIKMENSTIAVKAAEELIEKIDFLENNIDDLHKAMYYGNCALANRLNNCQNDDYEKLAAKAYNIAKEAKLDDLFYYCSMYATALYETGQYTNAYKITKEAYSLYQEYLKKHKIESNEMGIKLQSNIAEVAKEYSNMQHNRNKKMKLLNEAKINIVNVINELTEDNSIDDTKQKVYDLARQIFELLSECYK